MMDVLDGSCCLSPENRAKLTSCHDKSLVESTVNYIANSNDPGKMKACQLLTSVTHENTAACTQLCSYFEEIFDTLQHFDKHRGESQVAFDSSIYLLNMLTNCVEAVPEASKGCFGADSIAVLLNMLTRELGPISSMILDGTEREVSMEEEDMLVLGGNVSVLLGTLLALPSSPFTNSILYKSDDVSISKEFLWMALTRFVTLMEVRCGLVSLGLATGVLKLIDFLRG